MVTLCGPVTPIRAYVVLCVSPTQHSTASQVNHPGNVVIPQQQRTTIMQSREIPPATVISLFIRISGTTTTPVPPPSVLWRSWRYRIPCPEELYKFRSFRVDFLFDCCHGQCIASWFNALFIRVAEKRDFSPLGRCNTVSDMLNRVGGCVWYESHSRAVLLSTARIQIRITFDSQRSPSAWTRGEFKYARRCLWFMGEDGGGRGGSPTHTLLFIFATFACFSNEQGEIYLSPVPNGGTLVQAPLLEPQVGRQQRRPN